LIASGEVSSKENLLKFFSKTFFAKQYADLKRIESKLDKVILLLFKYGFITRGKDKILPTAIGKRVAELYIDPESAHLLIEKIKSRRRNDMFWLHSICSCTEMFPLLRVSPREFNELQNKYLDFSDEIEEPSPWDLDYEVWVRAFKTSLMLFDWINEKSDAVILEEYKETPGILRNRIYLSDWLLYSAYELARIMKAKDLLLPLNKLRIRVKNGAKEELLNLLQLKGIGRVRARKLYRAGVRHISDVKKMSQDKLASIVGKKIAEKIKSQVTEKSLNSNLYEY
jgi:helicase